MLCVVKGGESESKPSCLHLEPTARKTMSSEDLSCAVMMSVDPKMFKPICAHTYTTHTTHVIIRTLCKYCKQVVCQPET